MKTLFFFGPLEQFEILPLWYVHLGFLDISLTNQAIILILIFVFIIVYFFSLLNPIDGSLFVVPTRFQVLVEVIYSLVLGMVVDNINGKFGQKFFPLIFSVFCFIMCMNLIGLIPYSYTVTSHLVVTLAIGLSLFIGLNIICVRKHKLGFFSLFLPSQTSFILAFLLVPVEFTLYFFRPLSLAIRLFSNMMAGHTLLKLFGGFAWSLMNFNGILFLFYYIPLLTLLPLLGLELGVAMIQSFVFSLLICIYLNDALNLH